MTTAARDGIRAFAEALPESLERKGQTGMATEACVTRQPKGLSVFEKYLTVWVILCILGGIVLGHGAR